MMTAGWSESKLGYSIGLALYMVETHQPPARARHLATLERFLRDVGVDPGSLPGRGSTDVLPALGAFGLAEFAVLGFAAGNLPAAVDAPEHRYLDLARTLRHMAGEASVGPAFDANVLSAIEGLRRRVASAPDTDALQLEAGRLVASWDPPHGELPTKLKLGHLALQPDIAASVDTTYREARRCFVHGAHLAVIGLSGRILESVLHHLLLAHGTDPDKSSMGFHAIRKKLRDLGYVMLPGLDEQYDVIVAFRNKIVHGTTVIPTEAQAKAVLLLTVESIRTTRIR